MDCGRVQAGLRSGAADQGGRATPRPVSYGAPERAPTDDARIILIRRRRQ
jgi:hypothetical protein